MHILSPFPGQELMIGFALMLDQFIAKNA